MSVWSKLFEFEDLGATALDKPPSLEISVEGHDNGHVAILVEKRKEKGSSDVVFDITEGQAFDLAVAIITASQKSRKAFLQKLLDGIE